MRLGVDLIVAKTPNDGFEAEEVSKASGFNAFT